jgi:hypothetical protein
MQLVYRARCICSTDLGCWLVFLNEVKNDLPVFGVLHFPVSQKNIVFEIVQVHTCQLTFRKAIKVHYLFDPVI